MATQHHNLRAHATPLLATCTIITLIIVLHITGGLFAVARSTARRNHSKRNQEHVWHPGQRWSDQQAKTKTKTKMKTTPCVEVWDKPPCYFSLRMPTAVDRCCADASDRSRLKTEEKGDCCLWVVRYHPQLPDTPVEPQSPYPVATSSLRRASYTLNRQAF